MTYLAVIHERNKPPAKAATRPGEGGSPREQLLRKIKDRNRSGH